MFGNVNLDFAFPNLSRPLHRIVAALPYPLLFATISGTHVLPLNAVLGLEMRDEAVQNSCALLCPNGAASQSPTLPSDGYVG